MEFCLATGEGISAKRRQLDNSSTTYYQQGPTETIETYRMYTQPSRTVTQLTEETQVYQVPTHQQQQYNEITYSVQGTQPKYQPVSFLVSANQENITQASMTTDEDDQSISISPYQKYGTQFRTQPNQKLPSSYGDETSTTTTTTTNTTIYSQQPRNTGLIGTVARQPGPTTSYYQKPLSQESDSMQTESETSNTYFTRSTQQQPSSTSYTTTRPNFTKVIDNTRCSYI